jgi:hypothetical protein
MMAPQRESESTEITANSSSAAIKDQSYHSGEDSNNDVSLQESDPFSNRHTFGWELPPPLPYDILNQICFIPSSGSEDIFSKISNNQLIRSFGRHHEGKVTTHNSVLCKSSFKRSLLFSYTNSVFVFQKITENITERGKKIMKTELN